MQYRKPNQAKLGLEQLEDRLVPSASAPFSVPPTPPLAFEPPACSHTSHAETGLNTAALHTDVVHC
jgi:hypothetical protein